MSSGNTPKVNRLKRMKPDCVESQEWTYAIDNSGTRYDDVATHQIPLSDGTVLPFSQGGSSTGWTEQLEEWSANIQQAADDAGLLWFVEPRAVNNPIPADISGNYGGTPTGLPGAPSVVVAASLIGGGMVARYVNIQICPGQPVPVSAERLTSAQFTNNPYDLTTAGPVLGPIQKFMVCRTCGDEPVWFLEDGVTLASAGQIPNCWEPCGVLSQLPPPPSSDCSFEIDVACDNNNSANTVDFTNTITRRAKICNGEQIAVDYFQADPNDASALIPYTLIGDFVDCATGEPVALPVPECDRFEIVKLFEMDGELDALLTNREWQGTQPTTPLNNDPAVATPAGRAIRDAHDFSLPTSTAGTQNSLVLNDTDNTAAELSIQVLDGFIEVERGGWFRYAGSSEGYWAVELGECCGPLKDVAESGGFSPTRVMEFYLPAGIHQLRLWNVDSGGSNSSATFGYSPDGGVTYINDNTPPNIAFGTGKITETCVTAKVCEDTGAIFDLLTGDLLDPATLYTCSRATCSASCGGDEGGGASFDGNVTDVTPNPDQTHTLVTGTGNVPGGLKTVTINNISGTTTVAGGFELGNGRRVDSISFDATEVDRARGLLPAIAISGGNWQWIGLEPIAEV